MAADERTPQSANDYPAHQRNYSGFIKLLKVSAIITAILTAFVLVLIAN